MRRVILALLLCGGASAAFAQTLQAIVGDTHQSVGSSYAGPGDVTSFTGWWSCTFAYSAAVAAAKGNACDLRRADAATCTLTVWTDGTADLTNTNSCNGGTQTVTAWMNATTATVSKMYNQAGGTGCDSTDCDLVQASAGSQPDFILTGCGPSGTLPCIRGIGDHNLAHANVSYTAKAGYTFVSTRAASGSLQNSPDLLLNGSGDSFGWTSGVADQVTLSGVTGSITASQTDGTWYANNVVNNGASSAINGNGTETTGTATALNGDSAGGLNMHPGRGGGGTTGYIAEAGFWTGTAWTLGSGGTLEKLCNNQHARYGTTAGTRCVP